MCGVFLSRRMSIRDEVLILTDRFYSESDPDAVDRQSQLEKCLIIVLIAHLVTVVAFWRVAEVQKSKPHVIREIHAFNIDFEINVAPKEPEPEIVLKGIPLTNPDVPDSGAKKELLIKPPVRELKNKSLRTADSRIVPAPPPVVGAQGVRVPVAPVLPGEGGAGVVDGTTNGGVGLEGGGKGGGGLGAGKEAEKIAVLPPVATPPVREKRPINAYRNDLLMRIARNWKPGNVNYDVIVLLKIDQAGKLIESSIAQSSGHKKFDRAALKAVQATEYAPLPDWYKGADIPFLIQLSSDVVNVPRR